MYETKNTDEKIKAVMFIFLWSCMFLFLMAHKENNSKTVQEPLIMAFNMGKKETKPGITSGAGKILRLSITTTPNTKTLIAATNLNTALSLIFLFLKF